ncbi:tetratricopeptide repeat protein [Brucella pituitosa]
MGVTIKVQDGSGIFQHGEIQHEADLELDALLEQCGSGSLSPTSYLAALRKLVEQNPNFIDGYAHIGAALLNQGKPKLALGAYLQGYSVGQEAIPVAFSGKIEWNRIENRPFLRATQGAALCFQKFRQHKEAIEIMERLLIWNPNDNQGIRYALGSEYFRAGDVEKARSIMGREAASFPPYHYELALMDLIAGRYVKAATHLRRGFIENGYIAEMLCGATNPLPLAIWHGSNLNEPETAAVYFEHYGTFWLRTPEAVPFVRWLHTHPKVLLERAKIYEHKEELLWERDFQRRKALLDSEEVAVSTIDDTLSVQIVTERADRHGKPIAPWMYPDTRLRSVF